MARIDVASEQALVVVCDPSVTLPAGTDQDLLLRQLEPLVRDGKVFYLVTDDPASYRVELLAGEQPPAALDRHFEPSGGAFGLDVPTGRIGVHGWGRDGVPVLAGSVETTGASHVLSILSRRPFDGKRHDQDMDALCSATTGFTCSEWTGSGWSDACRSCCSASASSSSSGGGSG
jgi:hypothetical protein